MKSEKISLKSKLFEDAIATADAALAALVAKMKLRAADEGKLTLSIGIELEPVEVVDPDTGISMQMDAPRVSYKVTHSVPDKQTITGKTEDSGSAVFIECGWPHVIELDDDQLSLL